MNETGEIDEPTETPRRRRVHSRLLAPLAALLLAATAVVAFSAGSASAQTQNDNGNADQQQADDAAGTCDKDGTRRVDNLGRFGMGDTLTDLLGIDAETLREQLKGGSTLADIAAEQGVAVSEVIDALVTAITEKAAEHDREIDTDELITKITALVNGEGPERPDDDEGRRGRRGLHRGGFDGARHFGRHAQSSAA
ncbi:hypothetical protein [Candidatus Poriferisodalis sp.]|uniref:hypothetical protein n=1 Tax=Candidatus Poriferisodalis sp. TaxID=3101277 RepID=UPI003B022A46